jgi:signal transduction histidine kinase
MIVSILDTDALENDRVKLFISDIQISPLVYQVVKSFEKQASTKSIHLRFETDGESHFVKGESLFLIQVVENLVSNAIKFSGPNKKIDVRVREVGQHIQISVSDQGPGLTEEDISLLFKKFQRLSAKPTGDESSTGLGLSIVKRFIELMDGEVWCTSKPGEGATFTVQLPKV